MGYFKLVSVLFVVNMYVTEAEKNPQYYKVDQILWCIHLNKILWMRNTKNDNWLESMMKCEHPLD